MSMEHTARGRVLLIFATSVYTAMRRRYLITGVPSSGILGLWEVVTAKAWVNATLGSLVFSSPHHAAHCPFCPAALGPLPKHTPLGVSPSVFLVSFQLSVPSITNKMPDLCCLMVWVSEGEACQMADLHFNRGLLKAMPWYKELLSLVRVLSNREAF